MLYDTFNLHLLEFDNNAHEYNSIESRKYEIEVKPFTMWAYKQIVILNHKKINIISLIKMLNHQEQKFHIVNVEPYTSDLYSALLEPSFKSVQQSFVQYGTRRESKRKLYKKLLFAPITGIYIGTFRAVTTTCWRNIYQDYQKEDNKQPIDMFYLNYYLSPKKYPQMFKGIRPEIEVECVYQTSRKVLNTLVKHYISPDTPTFGSKLGFTLARAATTNLIAATTVYPLALNHFANYSTEAILSKTLHRAGSGSIINALREVGLNIVKSQLPSYKKISKTILALIGI